MLGVQEVGMEKYSNRSGQSGIVSYQISDDYITIQFMAGKSRLYLYSYSSAGRAAVETMKELARAGKGLHSYIVSRRPDYIIKS